MRLPIIAALAACTGLAAADPVHPRVLFDAAGLTEIQAKVKKEPWKSMYAVMKAGRPGEVFTQGKLSITGHWLQNTAFFAVVDNDRAAQSKAIEVLKTYVADPGFAANDKDLSRASRLRVASLAYDCLASTMQPADRTAVSSKLKALADDIDRSPGPGWPPYPGNNHHAVVWGGTTVGYLAQDETPYPAPQAKAAFDKVVKHFVTKYGGDTKDAPGWDPEGITYYHYSLACSWPAVLGARRAFNRDLAAEAPAMTNAPWLAMLQTVALPYQLTIGGQTVTQLGLHGDFTDEHNAYANDVGPMGGANAAFLLSPKATLPGVLFMYNRLVGAKGDKTFDTWRSGGILGLIAMPDDITEADPSGVPGLGRTWIDREWNLAVFRNRFQDGDDIVASHLAKRRNPTTNLHQGVDVNNIRIMGLGMQWITGPGGPMHKVADYRNAAAAGTTTVFPGDPATAKGSTQATGTLLQTFTRPAGDGWTAMEGSSVGTSKHVRRFIVDYSAKTGAAAAFVVADSSADGKVWRMNVPRAGTVAATATGFTVTAPNGAVLTATVLWPKGAKAAIGAFTQVPADGKGSYFMWQDGMDGKQPNKTVDIVGTDGRFLIAMTLTAKGAKPPAVAGSGDGLDQKITIGQDVITLAGTAAGAGTVVVDGWK
jgi:hypothetical protein